MSCESIAARRPSRHEAPRAAGRPRRWRSGWTRSTSQACPAYTTSPTGSMPRAGTLRGSMRSSPWRRTGGTWSVSARLTRPGMSRPRTPSACSWIRPRRSRSSSSPPGGAGRGGRRRVGRDLGRGRRNGGASPRRRRELDRGADHRGRGRAARRARSLEARRLRLRAAGHRGGRRGQRHHHDDARGRDPMRASYPAPPAPPAAPAPAPQPPSAQPSPPAKAAPVPTPKAPAKTTKPKKAKPRRTRCTSKSRSRACVKARTSPSPSRSRRLAPGGEKGAERP